jgi:hypothetical protein
MSTSREIAVRPAQEVVGGFDNQSSFGFLEKAAKQLASSQLIPVAFQNKVADCMIIIEMSQRTGFPAMMVAQNIYIVYGKPGWSSQFIIALINARAGLGRLQYRTTGTGPNRECVAWTKHPETGDVLESPPITIAMATAEGWVSKNGSKWKTMPELMLRYRAATLFGRLYCPELLMGLKSDDELEDITAAQQAEVDTMKEAKATVVKSLAPEVVERLTKQTEVIVAPGAPVIGHYQSIIEKELSKDVAFDDFRTFLEQTKRMADTSALSSWIDIPDAVAEALAKDPKAMQQCATQYGNI